MTIRGGEENVGEGDEGRGMRGQNVENKCDFSCRRKEQCLFCSVKLVWQPVPEDRCSIAK